MTEHPEPTNTFTKHPWTGTFICLLAIVILAGYLRIRDLSELPPPLHVDEAAQGLNALEIMDGSRSLSEFGWTHHLNTSFLASGVILRLFGPTVWNLRITEVIFGVLAVILTYFLGRSMFSWRVGIVAAAMMSFNHFAVAFSRIGLVNQQSMTIELLAFVLLWEGFKRRHRLLIMGGGVMSGVGLYLYFAGWIVPVILATVILWLMVFRQPLVRSTWKYAVWGILGFLIAILPWLTFPILKPAEFRSRPTEVLILSDLDRYKAIWGTDSTLQVLRFQTYDAIKLFIEGGDTSNQYGSLSPFLDPTLGWLFILGLGIVILFSQRSSHIFLLIWFGLTLIIGGVLTDTPPFSPRLVGLFPAVTLLTALGMVTLLELLNRLLLTIPLPAKKLSVRYPARKHIISILIFATVLTTGIVSFNWHYKAYFLNYPLARYTIYWPWIEPMSTIGRYLSTQDDGTNAYIFRTPAVYSNHPGIRFYLYDNNIEIKDVACSTTACAIPKPNEERSLIYIFLPETQNFIRQVKEELPGGTIISFTGRTSWEDNTNREMFIAYEIH